MMNYECKVESKSPIRRELTITVKSDSIKKVMDEQFESLKKKAKIKGFRAGKVPLGLIKQYYSEDVKANVFSRVIRESYIQALEENKLTVVGSPEIEPKSGMDLHDGEPLTFTANIEVFPEIKVGDLTKVKASRLSTEVKDEDVEKAVENLRNNHAEILPSSDEGPAKAGDYLEISFKGTVEGQALESLAGENRLVNIGSKQFLEDFENGLIGMKKGETKSFPISFAKDFADSKLAGKTADFEVKVHEFKRKELPAFDDEFAKQFKIETALELRKKIAESLKEDKETQSRQKLKEDVLEALVRSHEFEVPAGLVQSQLEYLVKENAETLKRQGFTEKMTKDYLKKNKEDLEKHALNQVKASLILDRISQDQSIKIEKSDLEHEFAKISERLKIKPADVQSLYQNDQNALSQLRFRMREDRAIDYVLSQVKLV